MNKNYLFGYKAERRAKLSLQIAGYYVMTSRKSGGIFDLIAVKADEVLLIQIKSTHEKTPPAYKKDLEKMERIFVPEKCRKELWVWISRKGWTTYSVK